MQVRCFQGPVGGVQKQGSDTDVMTGVSVEFEVQGFPLFIDWESRAWIRYKSLMVGVPGSSAALTFTLTKKQGLANTDQETKTKNCWYTRRLHQLSRGIERTYLGGAGGSSDGRMVYIWRVLCIRQSIWIFLVISWRNANYRIYLNQIRSQSYKNTSCTRFDREGTRSTVLCSLKQFTSWILLLYWFYSDCLACFADCQIQGKFKDSNIWKYKHF